MMLDKHVVKMILETAQLLSTAHRVLDGTFEALDNGSCRVTVDGIPYLVDHDSEGWMVLEENGLGFGMHNTSLLEAIKPMVGRRHPGPR